MVASLGALASGALPTAQAKDAANPKGGRPKYHICAGHGEDCPLGLFQQVAEAVIEIDSGDYVTIEALTHHANDDAERMIKGDPGQLPRGAFTPSSRKASSPGTSPDVARLPFYAMILRIGSAPSTPTRR